MLVTKVAMKNQPNIRPVLRTSKAGIGAGAAGSGSRGATELLRLAGGQILALYYEEELTLAEIGEVIGVGESRVSQLRTQAIARLRASLQATLAPKDAA